MAWWFVAVSAILTVFVARRAAARQMCWSCQYQTNSYGKECVDAPGNWTGGLPRIRCPGLCLIDARYDSLGDLTFIARGCTTSDDKRINKCMKAGTGYICMFTCEGENYCNGQNMETLNYEETGPNGATVFTFGWSNSLMWAILTCLISAAVTTVIVTS